MDKDHIAPGKLFAPAHLLLHHLAVVDDELEIEIAHRGAGFALASRGLLDVAQAPTELEIGRLDSVLQHRAIDLRGHGVDESGVALEFGKAEGRSKALDHRVHEIGDDVLRVVELDPSEEARIARDIGDCEIGQFRVGSIVTSLRAAELGVACNAQAALTRSAAVSISLSGSAHAGKFDRTCDCASFGSTTPGF